VKRVIGFLGDHIAVRDEEGLRTDVEMFITDDGDVKAYPQDHPDHPNNKNEEKQ
jgi:hypothetical protein